MLELVVVIVVIGIFGYGGFA
nr:hypothetical protein [uncultured Campylobacter sp.]